MVIISFLLLLQTTGTYVPGLDSVGSSIGKEIALVAAAAILPRSSSNGKDLLLDHLNLFNKFNVCGVAGRQAVPSKVF